MGGRGVGRMEWGGKWDNCNSIINKYILKKRKKKLNPKKAYYYLDVSSLKSKY